MQRIAQHELQRVLPRCELELDFGLPAAEVPDVVVRRQRRVERWHLRDVDQQMVMTRVRIIHACGGDTGDVTVAPSAGD